MKKGILIVMASLFLTITMGFTAYAGQWKQDSKGWRYQNDDRSYQKSGWYNDGLKWYYFNQTGYMQTGWTKVNDNWYFLKSDGAMAIGWWKDGNSWYYLKSDGTMATGWWKDGNSWYYLKSDGTMATGWWKDGNSWYYLEPSGAIVRSTKKAIDGAYYSFDENGAWTGDTAIIEVSKKDTIQWFNNTYAILTASNRDDYRLFAGMEKNDSNKQKIVSGLQSAWNITDRASADKTLDWLLSSGHRVSYADEMELYNNLGMMDMTQSELMTTFGYSNYLYYEHMQTAYKNKGAQAIDAWDYCRAMQLSAWYYIADYYTEEEALNKSLEIALVMQKKFSSWDDMSKSYLYGYEYWTGSAAMASMRDLYWQTLKGSNGPFTLDWNLPLRKTW